MSRTLQPSLTVQDKAIAQVFVNSEDQPSQQVWLSHRAVGVMRGGLEEKILLSQIRQVTFQHRKPLLPMIGGGALLAFAALAIYQDRFDPFLLLLFFFGAFFLFYFGVNGYPVMSIEQETSTYDIRLREVQPHHRAFATMVNQVLVHADNGKQWWLWVPYAPLDHQPDATLQTPDAGWAWMSVQQVSQEPPMGSWFVKVDMARAHGHFEPSEEGGKGLRFVGTLPPESIIFVKRPSHFGTVSFT